MFSLVLKQKAPHSYSDADENASSFTEFGITEFFTTDSSKHVK